MNIKHGDTVTLDNGDVVKISLEIINKKITELEVNKKYRLQKTNSICHIATSNYNYPVIEKETIENNIWTYLQKLQISCEDYRYIFYTNSNGKCFYTMFGTENLDFVVLKIN